jgi:hypothetical protein
MLCFTQCIYADHIESQQQNSTYSQGVITSGSDIKYDLINEKENTGWALYIDNDVLVSGGEIDQDYTGGISVTLSGLRATNYLLSIDGARQTISDWLRLDKLYKNKPHINLHSFNFGFTLFTPSDLTISEPIFDDHPYASYFFISNSNIVVVPEDDMVYQTILSIGFLGLDAAEDVQTSLHSLFGANKPMGWDNQISSGGEPTAKYTFAAQKILNRSQGSQYARHEFKITGEANVGFLTNASVGFNWRWGRITTPWWSFNPHLSDYINMGVPIVKKTEKTHDPEFYIWFMASYQLRFYSALLQGQFRDSVVTFSDDELERTTTDLSLGITREFGSDIRISLFYRQRSAALKLPDARKPKWGGIIISKSF